MKTEGSQPLTHNPVTGSCPKVVHWFILFQTLTAYLSLIYFIRIW